MLEKYIEKFNRAMRTSINAMREVLDEAWSADWKDGEYMAFMAYVDEFVD